MDFRPLAAGYSGQKWRVTSEYVAPAGASEFVLVDNYNYAASKRGYEIENASPDLLITSGAWPALFNLDCNC
jgi:hypothetical protein